VRLADRARARATLARLLALELDDGARERVAADLATADEIERDLAIPAQ
jgi:hypothetical protein